MSAEGKNARPKEYGELSSKGYVPWAQVTVCLVGDKYNDECESRDVSPKYPNMRKLFFVNCSEVFISVSSNLQPVYVISTN